MSWIFAPMLGGLEAAMIKQLASKRMVIATVGFMVAGGAFRLSLGQETQ
jgi:hypothetical protein